MGNDMRKLIDQVKNFGNPLNEDKPVKEWTEEIQKGFDEWMLDDNVIKRPDGTYTTQDAQYRNRLIDLNALKQYYMREFIS
jgi:hypothetical protein